MFRSTNTKNKTKYSMATNRFSSAFSIRFPSYSYYENFSVHPHPTCLAAPLDVCWQPGQQDGCSSHGYWGIDRHTNINSFWHTLLKFLCLSPSGDFCVLSIGWVKMCNEREQWQKAKTSKWLRHKRTQMNWQWQKTDLQCTKGLCCTTQRPVQ